MSDFESLGKEYFREFKQKTALDLSNIDVQSYNLKQIDNRLNIQIEALHKKKIRVREIKEET